MERELKDYVDALFEDMPKTARAFEVRDEIYANVLERYHDLTSSGMPPKEAFEQAKKSIGNMQDIERSLREPQPTYPDANPDRKRRSLLLSVGLACWVLAGGSIAIFSTFGMLSVGLICLFVFAALGLGLTVYANSAYKQIPPPEYPKITDQEMEEFQQWRAEKLSGTRKNKIYSTVLWSVIVVLYFLISFTTGAWPITWVIFIIGAAADKILELALEP